MLPNDLHGSVRGLRRTAQGIAGLTLLEEVFDAVKPREQPYSSCLCLCRKRVNRRVDIGERRPSHYPRGVKVLSHKQQVVFARGTSRTRSRPDR